VEHLADRAVAGKCARPRPTFRHAFLSDVPRRTAALVRSVGAHSYCGYGRSRTGARPRSVSFTEVLMSEWRAETQDAALARISHLVAARELERFALGVDRIDIRRWPVFGSDGLYVGIVDRLLVETGTGKIRYASVLVAAELSAGGPRAPAGSVLVPIGLVHLLTEREEIVIDFLTTTMLADAPRLHARPITRADEDATLVSYGMATSRDVGEQLYAGALFDERRIHRSPAD
jgi:hypothetical protein